jgi:hypothetical protein
MSSPVPSRSFATALGTSACRSSDAFHASGSVSDVEATHFGLELSGSATACSPSDAFGQYEAKISAL